MRLLNISHVYLTRVVSVPIGNFFLNEAIPFLDKQLNEFIENIKNVTDEEKKAMLDNANKFILVYNRTIMRIV